MTKFEEEAMNEFAKSEYVYTAYDGTFRGETDGTVMEFAKGTTIYTFPWLEFAKNWHSNEEYQELLKENNKLKPQLPQQALPVVPECVAEFIESYKDRRTIYGVFDKISKNLKTYPKLYEWVFEDENSQATFALAFITGKYQVEKPQLFRLKLKNAPISNYYLWLNQATGKVFVDKKFLDWTNHDNVKNIFTKQEIAKISDGAFVNNEAFELMPVEDGE